MANKLKVRQPLAKVEVILSDTTHQKWLEEHDELLRDELNVKKIEYTKDAEKYITYQVQPNFKRLGPRMGKLLPGCKAQLAQGRWRKAAGRTDRERQGDACNSTARRSSSTTRTFRFACKPSLAGRRRRGRTSLSCSRRS